MPNEIKPVIYQLMVRYFGNTNETNQKDGTLAINGCGRFADVNVAALRSLRNLGVTHVWLTGCLRQATLTDYSALGLPPDDPDVVKGIAGSFYAVRDYFDVCPDYAVNPAARLAEFDALIDRIHRAGMKALIDFVPNHVARGYRSVVRPDLSFGEGDDITRFFHPNNHFFYLAEPPGQALRLTKPPGWNPAGVDFDGLYPPEDGSPGRPAKSTGNNVTSSSPSLYDWYETVKLNYGYDFTSRTGHYDPRPRTWAVMDEVLAHWQARGVDGFRCDFAHYIPPEAWSYLIAAARRRNREVYFFAEAYPWAGSGDPITDRQQLVDAGFDAVYDDHSYNQLKRIYQGTGGQEDYDQALMSPPAAARYAVRYLENHDERRIASSIVTTGGPGDSGFGSADAGYQLAPLQLLSSPGPVLVYNGQEVGEPAAGAEGYGGDDGRTTLFDYWCMPSVARWVNGHAYDGARLTDHERALRQFYSDLLALCQDPAIRGDGFYGLKYFNHPDNYPDCPDDLYSFARFKEGAGRLLIVAATFAGADQVTHGRLRVPSALADLAGLQAHVTVRLRLDRRGSRDDVTAQMTRDSLLSDGFALSIPGQSSHVYLIQ